MGSRRGRLLCCGCAAVVSVALLALWVLNVSRAGTGVEGCAAGCASSRPRREGPLRVLSLNVLHDFPRFEHLDQRLAIVAQAIQDNDADIVCLQEVPWHWGSAARRLGERTGRNHLYLRANGNRWALLFEEGEAILSRFPLSDPAFIELEPRVNLFEHRVALRATAATPWGPVQVTVTHLTHGEPDLNAGQAASLGGFVAGAGEGPALVAGDFNAKEDEPQIRALGWVDAYREAHPEDPGFTCCVDDLVEGRVDELDKRIDYLFLVPSSRTKVVSSRRVLDRPSRPPEAPGKRWHSQGDRWDGSLLWASDHVGLLSEIELVR